MAGIKKKTLKRNLPRKSKRKPRSKWTWAMVDRFIDPTKSYRPFDFTSGKPKSETTWDMRKFVEDNPHIFYAPYPGDLVGRITVKYGDGPYARRDVKGHCYHCGWIIDMTVWGNCVDAIDCDMCGNKAFVRKGDSRCERKTLPPAKVEWKEVYHFFDDTDIVIRNANCDPVFYGP